jgi:hypothetical protein
MVSCCVAINCKSGSGTPAAYGKEFNVTVSVGFPPKLFVIAKLAELEPAEITIVAGPRFELVLRN